DAAVRYRREGQGRNARQGIVGGRRVEVVGGQVGTDEAGRIGKTPLEGFEERGTGIAGEGRRGRKDGDGEREARHESPLQGMASGGILAGSCASVQSGGEHVRGRVSVAGAGRTGQRPPSASLPARRGGTGPLLHPRRD